MERKERFREERGEGGEETTNADTDTNTNTNTKTASETIESKSCGVAAVTTTQKAFRNEREREKGNKEKGNKEKNGESY